jgi:hypothetical protein
LELANKEKTLSDVVKMAIQGIIDECFSSLHLTSDKACFMRDLLRKGFAGDIIEATGKVDPYVKISEEAANRGVSRSAEPPPPPIFRKKFKPPPPTERKFLIFSSRRR